MYKNFDMYRGLTVFLKKCVVGSKRFIEDVY